MTTKLKRPATIKIPVATCKQIRLIGAQMSNTCYNLSQRPGEPLSEHNATIMRGLYEQWDAISRYLNEVQS